MSNSLGNISNINLDSFKTDATYYLSKSGEVKKAGLWFNFKLWANIGNSRNKVIDLLNAVKDKMVSATDSAASIVNFEDSIKNKKDKYNVKLSTLLQNFKASNARGIYVGESKKIAEKKVSFFVGQIPCDNSETRQELKKYLFEKLSRLYDIPPLKNSEDGKGKVLDERTLCKQMETDLEQIGQVLRNKLQSGRLIGDSFELLKLDSLYLNYFKEKWSSLMDLVDIKPKKDAFDDSLLSDPSLLKKKQFPEIAEHVKSVLDTTKDGILKNILTKNVKHILVNDIGNLCTLDEVKEKFKDITKTYFDLTCKCENDTSKKIAGEFLNEFVSDIYGFASNKLKEGSAQKVFDMINTEAPKLFAGISENPSQEELSKLMGNIQLSIDKIAVETGILYDDAEDTKEAVRQFILGEMISNLSPDDQEKVFNMTNSLSFAKVYTILDKHTHDANTKIDSIARLRTREDEKLFSRLYKNVNNGVLLKKVMKSLKSAACTVNNPNDVYIPRSNKELQRYVGIDMNSGMANTVMENSGFYSKKFNGSVFLN